MNQNSQGGDGTGRSGSDEAAARSAFVTVQPQQGHAQGITASQLAAMAAGQNAYTNVDHSAAFMMSNAAATLAAVAASAVQHMTQASAPQPAPGAPGAPSATLSSSLYHAALQGNRNALMQGGSASQQVSSVPHAALLTALANAGQQAAVQSIPSPPAVPGHSDAATAAASSMLRPNPPVLSQPTTNLTSPALLSDMHCWSVEQLGMYAELLTLQCMYFEICPYTTLFSCFSLFHV